MSHTHEPAIADHVSSTDAALALGISREQLVRLIERGQLRGGRVLGRWFVTRASLQAALADRTPIPA